MADELLLCVGKMFSSSLQPGSAALGSIPPGGYTTRFGVTTGEPVLTSGRTAIGLYSCSSVPAILMIFVVERTASRERNENIFKSLG